MQKRVSSPWPSATPPPPSHFATSPRIQALLLPLANPPRQHLGRPKQGCCQGFLLHLGKTSNILLLSHTWLLGLISIVNSFTSRRFEGSSPGSPAQQLQCHANCTLHTAHCTLHTARCTLYGTHCMLNSAQWTVRCTWLLPTAYTMHTKQRKLNSVQWTHCTLRSAL